MAVEVTGFEMVPGPTENGNEGEKSVLLEKGNAKFVQGPEAAEPIKFGSYGDEPARGVGSDVVDSKVPKDAVEEWPAPKQIFSFYVIRFRPYDAPNIKSKIDQLDKEMNRKKEARFRIYEAINEKRSDRAELLSQLKSLRDNRKQFQSILDEKRKEIEPLQQALGKLRTTNNGGRGGLCSSEEELNNIIYSIQYRIQHESISLSEEKQLLREIKQLEGTREKVIANAAMRAKLQDSLGQKEAIQDQVKLIGGDLDGVRKEKQAVQTRITKIEDSLKIIDKEIQSLRDELKIVTEKKDQAYEGKQQLIKQREEGNTHYYQSRIVLNKMRELAAKKDINALEEFSQSEVDKFMLLWSNDKAFRDDYEKRILQSLDMRQLSRDGRIRNPDQKPLLEEPKTAETHTSEKTNIKPPKEESKPKPQDNIKPPKEESKPKPQDNIKPPKEESKPKPQDTIPPQKVQKETRNKGRDLKSNVGGKDLAETDEFEYEKLPKVSPANESEIDLIKLKEMKREEEIAKAKHALERKKKLAEKAAAKAALRAQKEAEKKLKEREKKAKKKAASSAPALNVEEPADAVVDVTEQERVDDNVEVPVPVKEKVRKENTIRSRSRTKGPESIPKLVIKRKRSNNYQVWFACAAAVLILLVLILVYKYLF